MNNLVPFIDMKSDTWTFPAPDGLYPYIIYFDFLPNEWFVQTVKQITKDCIGIGRLKISTLCRYNTSLKIFFEFLEAYDITLGNFRDVTFDIVEAYTHYLLANVKKPQTRSVAMASLKHHIKHGQLFEWDGFPLTEVFDGTERRTLQTEDSLKSMLIDDRIMTKIDTALREMKATLEPRIDYLNRVVLWSLITVIRHTGVRLSEALRLKEGCIKRDILKKHLLEIISEKNETDRFIPVSREVVQALEYLSQTTKELRSSMDSDKLFYYYQSRKKCFSILPQKIARDWLKSEFIAPYDVRDIDGELAIITYHQFRHQIGTDLLNNGMSMVEVQQYLGHESLHSTRLYAKVRNDRLTKEYKKLGFIGMVESRVEEVVDEKGVKPDAERRLMAQLPDGVCAKPINKKVANCKRPNACLFCPKFITTPEFIDVHKDHLERIRADKVRYMAEDLFGNDYLLFETEKVLVDILKRLETLQTEGVTK